MTDEMMKLEMDEILKNQDIEKAITWVKRETEFMRWAHNCLVYANMEYRESQSDKIKKLVEKAEVDIYNYETLLIAAQKKLFELIEK